MENPSVNDKWMKPLGIPPAIRKPPNGAKNGQYSIHRDFNDECWWDGRTSLDSLVPNVT